MHWKIFLAPLVVVSMFFVAGCNTQSAPVQESAQNNAPTNEMSQEIVPDSPTTTGVVTDDGAPQIANDDVVALSAARYEDYTAQKFAAVDGSEPHVLFFHAKWCPTCRQMEKDILANLSSLPEGTQILKVDYDTEEALKTRFGIKIQSSVVVVDADGDVVWSGQDPAFDDLKKHIQASLGS